MANKKTYEFNKNLKDLSVFAFVYQHFPLFPIQGMVQNILMKLIGALAQAILIHILIGIVYLDGVDRAELP